MKTYEEMAQSALARGKAIRRQRNKTKIIILGALSAMAACGMMILLAMGILDKRPTIKPSEDTQILATEGCDSNTDPTSGPLNYGAIHYLSVTHKTDTGISGESFQYLAGTRNPVVSQPDSAPPAFRFQHGYIHVVARAVEEYSGEYETLNEYGSTTISKYRLFRMQVVDPLDSGMDGDFFYLLPTHLKGDLTQYDALLISMTQLSKNFLLRQGDELTAFEYLFTDPYGEPELGNIIGFTDGVFDETLWQDRSWIYGYQFAQYFLEHDTGDLLVSRGSTLEEALRRRQAQIDEWGDWYKGPSQVKHFDFQTEEAKTAMDYIKPFENGVFVPRRNSQNYVCYRYINGCPTNEWVSIDYENEEVTTSDYRFEDADFENLPDLTAYVTSLDLSQIAPQHTDPSGKILIFNSAVGWYEKTETGVYSIVRIAWRYFAEDNYYMEYYDETFILLDETGDYIISREELIALIGDNRNIYHGEYGIGMEMPMV